MKIDHPDRLACYCWLTTAILGAFIVITQLGTMLSLALRGAGFPWVVPLSLLLALAVGDWLAVGSGRTGRSRLWPLSLAITILVGAFGISTWYFDLSWDGQWYHQTAICTLARNWNPLTDPMREFLPHLELWVRHYTKGPWYVAAAIYRTTGSIEAGKCTATIAWVAMGLSVFAASLEYGLRRRQAAMVAFLVAMNPVVMSEITTYLVDGILYGFLVIVAAALFSLFRRPQPVVLWVAPLAGIIAINAKLTGLVFACFIFAAGWIWCAAYHRRWLVRYTGGTAGVLLIAVVGFGYNPYVTNTVHRHHPFYPVLGTTDYPSLTMQGREGIERLETPKNVMGRSRLIRFAYATFGRPGNAPYHKEPNAVLMAPFGARPADLFYYRYHETRIAGFGPWFSGILLLGLGLGVALLWQRSVRWPVLLCATTIAASLLISLHLWWPRYGPQFWLLPVVAIAFAFSADSSRGMRIAAWGLAALLAVNALIVATVHLTWETRSTLTLRSQLHGIVQSNREIEIAPRYFEIPIEERLKTWGIKYQTRKPNELRDGLELMSVVEGYPGAVKYRIPQ